MNLFSSNIPRRLSPFEYVIVPEICMMYLVLICRFFHHFSNLRSTALDLPTTPIYYMRTSLAYHPSVHSLLALCIRLYLRKQSPHPPIHCFESSLGIQSPFLLPTFPLSLPSFLATIFLHIFLLAQHKCHYSHAFGHLAMVLDNSDFKNYRSTCPIHFSSHFSTNPHKQQKNSGESNCCQLYSIFYIVFPSHEACPSKTTHGIHDCFWQNSIFHSREITHSNLNLPHNIQYHLGQVQDKRLFSHSMTLLSQMKSKDFRRKVGVANNLTIFIGIMIFDRSRREARGICYDILLLLFVADSIQLQLVVTNFGLTFFYLLNLFLIVFILEVS